MEIGATSLNSSFLPAQFAEARAARSFAREISGSQETAINKNRKSEDKPTESQTTGSTRADEVERQRLAQAKEAEPAQKTQAANVGGAVKLDVEEGHRVLKVFDSKDILIYQLPPKGALQLIKSQESAQQPQVETSA